MTFGTQAEYCFESLFRKRELAKFYSKLSEFCAKSSVGSLWHPNNRPRGTHRVISLEVGEAIKLSEFGV